MQLRLPGMDRVADLLLLALCHARQYPYRERLYRSIYHNQGMEHKIFDKSGIPFDEWIAYLLMRTGVPFDEKSLAHYARTR